MAFPIAWNLPKYRHRTADLLGFVGIVAVWMTVTVPIFYRKPPPPRVRADVLIRVEPPFATMMKGLPLNRVGVEKLASDYGEYLRSSQAVQDVLSDPAVSSLPSSPTADTVERCLSKQIQVVALGGTYLIDCWLIADDPARDTAILNAAATSIVIGQTRPPGYLVTILAPATPNTVPVPDRVVSPVWLILFILIVSLVSFALLRTLGASVLSFISPDRKPS